jgi:hypothetical protein
MYGTCHISDAFDEPGQKGDLTNKGAVDLSNAEVTVIFF